MASQYMTLKKFRERVLEIEGQISGDQKLDERLKKGQLELESLMEQKKKNDNQAEKSLMAKEELELKIVTLKDRIKKIRKEVKQASKENEQTLDWWTQECRRYTELLGLTITRISPKHYVSVLRYEFTNIDKANPERVFYATVKIDEDLTIEVNRCEPMVGCGMKGLREAVQGLKADSMDWSQWHSFLVWLRRQFVLLV